MRTIPVGTDALLVELDSAAEARAWHQAIARLRDGGGLQVTDVVPGARTVLLDGLADPSGVARLLSTVDPSGSDDDPGPVVSLPVRFDGPDLRAVAEAWGTAPADVGRLLTATELVVAFCGFAPGFPYLVGLPEPYRLPRLATPRTRVPAGSVGLADEFVGVYPSASPGGWRLVGRTDVVLFDPAREPPALLSPGRRVRLVDAG